MIVFMLALLVLLGVIIFGVVDLGFTLALEEDLALLETLGWFLRFGLERLRARVDGMIKWKDFTIL